LITAAALLALAILVRVNPRSELDVEMLGTIAGWAEGHSMDDWFDFVAVITGFRAAIVVMVASVIVAPLITRPNNTIAYLLTLLVFGVMYMLCDLALKEYVGVTRPDPNSDALSFPSGHVAGVVTAGVLLVYILVRRRAHLLLILSMATLSIFTAYSVTLARLVQEAHWPSDILGGYIFGVLGLLIFIPIYHRLERVRWIDRLLVIRDYF
jgi:undecaprenyl-diphosphatase